MTRKRDQDRQSLWPGEPGTWQLLLRAELRFRLWDLDFDSTPGSQQSGPTATCFLPDPIGNRCPDGHPGTAWRFQVARQTGCLRIRPVRPKYPCATAKRATEGQPKASRGLTEADSEDSILIRFRSKLLPALRWLP